MLVMVKKNKAFLAKPLVSIVLLNWNGFDALKENLESVKKNTRYPAYEIILVDNGSTDGSVEFVKKHYPKIIIIKNPVNYGIPKASNQGMRKAKGKYIIFMSNDTLATPGWMTALVEVISSNPKISTVGAMLVGRGQADQFKREPIELEKNSVCSAAMIVSRKAWQNVGEYDEENFTPYGGDETDWNYRAINIGYQVLETKRAVIEHVGQHDTAKQNPQQYFLLHYHTWKAILFNSSFPQFLKRLPGQALIFLSSFKFRKTLALLKVYASILKDLPKFRKFRQLRQAKAKKAVEEQKKIKDWF